jgi:hypothetical protein
VRLHCRELKRVHHGRRAPSGASIPQRYFWGPRTPLLLTTPRSTGCTCSEYSRVRTCHRHHAERFHNGRLAAIQLQRTDCFQRCFQRSIWQPPHELEATGCRAPLPSMWQAARNSYVLQQLRAGFLLRAGVPQRSRCAAQRCARGFLLLHIVHVSLANECISRTSTLAVAGPSASLRSSGIVHPSGACATARSVVSRLMYEEHPNERDVASMQDFVRIVGRQCNPVSSSYKLGPSCNGSKEALRFLHEHPGIIQRAVADHLFLCCHLLMHERFGSAR